MAFEGASTVRCLRFAKWVDLRPIVWTSVLDLMWMLRCSTFVATGLYVPPGVCRASAALQPLRRDPELSRGQYALLEVSAMSAFGTADCNVRHESKRGERPP